MTVNVIATKRNIESFCSVVGRPRNRRMMKKEILCVPYKLQKVTGPYTGRELQREGKQKYSCSLKASRAEGIVKKKNRRYVLPLNEE